MGFSFFLKCPLEFQIDELLELELNLLRKGIHGYKIHGVSLRPTFFLFMWINENHPKTVSITCRFLHLFIRPFFSCCFRCGTQNMWAKWVDSTLPIDMLQGEKFGLRGYWRVCVTSGIPCSSGRIWNRSLNLHTVAPGWGWVQASTLCLSNDYSGTAPWGAAALCRETSQ